jgi:Response regulator containing CheY-like receiver domain and AraC-type DNA-binding domain
VLDEPKGVAVSSETGNVGTGPLRILIAEDQAIIRLDLRGILEKHGLIVCAEASNGEEAVELARTSHPDIALLDMRMPKLDGIEAARRMYAERPIPIVMLTAFSDRAVVEKAIAAGVFAYLVKPFKESDLVPALRAAVVRHAELLAARRAVGEAPLRPVVISVRSPSGNDWPPLRIERTEDGGIDVQPVEVPMVDEQQRARP